ncbi:MAG: hypothetical protein JXB49_14250 [Bacteroidales bacterium]|nr:hypothetical protein [Bacteroidales bacterium]
MSVDTKLEMPVFKLPDHSSQLKKADEVIESLKHNIKDLETNNNINDKIHSTLYEETVRILDYVGTLSIPVFRLEEEIESHYTMKFLNAPELSKKLFNDHYEKLHRPYTLLKNRCFKILEDLDELYLKRWKKNPPNWNI